MCLLIINPASYYKKQQIYIGEKLANPRAILNFTPSFTPKGEHSVLFRRMEGQTENFTPRG
jgi:hypothetical protein